MLAKIVKAVIHRIVRVNGPADGGSKARASRNIFFFFLF